MNGAGKYALAGVLAVPIAWLMYRSYSRSTSSKQPSTACTPVKAGGGSTVQCVNATADLKRVSAWLSSHSSGAVAWYAYHHINNRLNGSLPSNVVKVYVDNMNDIKAVISVYRTIYIVADRTEAGVSAIKTLVESGVIEMPRKGATQIYFGSLHSALKERVLSMKWYFADGAAGGYTLKSTYDEPFECLRLEKKSDFIDTLKSHYDSKRVYTHPTTRLTYTARIERLRTKEDAKMVDDLWQYNTPFTLPFVELLIARFPAFAVRLIPTVQCPAGTEAPFVSWNISTDYSGSGLQYTREEWRGCGFANLLVAQHIRCHHIIQCNRSNNTATAVGRLSDIPPYPLRDVEGGEQPFDCNTLTEEAHQTLCKTAKPMSFISPKNIASLKNSQKCGFQSVDTVLWIGANLITNSNTCNTAVNDEKNKQC